MWPFDDIGAALGDQFKSMVASAFEAAMTAIWDASLAVLRTAFQLADQFTVFSVSTTEGPLKVVWPMMLWISGVLAIGLFSWQLIMTNVRGGRGFMRLVTGPVQYGIALAVTVGMVAEFLAAVDGLTDGILTYGLASRNFTDALNHTTFTDAASDGVKAVVLGVCAINATELAVWRACPGCGGRVACRGGISVDSARRRRRERLLPRKGGAGRDRLVSVRIE